MMLGPQGIEKGFIVLNLCLILSSPGTDWEHTQRNTHWQKSGAYLAHYLSIKVRGELSLPPRDACQNTGMQTQSQLFQM